MRSIFPWLAVFVASGASHLVAQVTETRSIHVGDQQVAGVLPVTASGDHNTATCGFLLDLTTPQTITITLESFDFDCCVTATEPRSKTICTDRNSGVFTNAWLVCVNAQAGSWQIEVGSENANGGEFTLSVLPGHVDPPSDPLERARSTIAYFENGSKRAQMKGNFIRAAHWLGNATQYAYSINDIASARTLAERHLKLAQEKQLTDEVCYANGNLGAVELAFARFDHARELLEAARPGAEEMLTRAAGTSTEHAAVMFTCFVYEHLADAIAQSVSPAAALPNYRRFADLATRTHDAEAQVQAHGKLSDALDRTGDSKGAKAELENAARIAHESRDASAITSAELAHAGFLKNHGEPEAALVKCRDALRSPLPPARQQDFLIVATQAYIDLGRHEQALEAMDRIDELLRLSRFEGAVIVNRINRAKIAYQVRDFALARSLLEQTLAATGSSLSREQRIEVLLNLALIDREADRRQDAEEQFVAAIRECEAMGDLRQKTRILTNLGNSQAERGYFAAALSSFDQAEQVAEDQADDRGTAFVRASRAYSLYLAGELDAAQAQAQEAARKLESLGELAGAIDVQDTLARIGLKRRDVGAARHAVSTADELFDRQPRQKLDVLSAAGARTRFADWGSIAQDVIALQLNAEGLAPSLRRALSNEGWRSASRWKARVLLEGIRAPETARHDGPDRGMAGEPEPELGSRTALIEYVDGLDELSAYVVTADDARWIPLGQRADIEQCAERFVRELSSIIEPPANVIEHASRLYEMLMTPVLRSLPHEISTLIVVPTSRLAIVPFDGLVPPSSLRSRSEMNYVGVRYLIDDYCVALAPSSAVVTELQRKSTHARAFRALILGDPIYGSESIALASTTRSAESARLRSSLVDLARLKSSREETIEIARLLLPNDSTAKAEKSAELLASFGHRTDTIMTQSFELDLGANANPSRLTGDLSAFSCIHVAAHGHIDANDPRRSGLVLSYEPSHEGLVSLPDVLAMHIDTDLVVLSGCHTASGPILRGEGVQSLAYGFLRAGSRGVIASLWGINDHDAADLMKSLYSEYLEKGLHPAFALRQAKLEFRHSNAARGGSASGEQSPPSMIAANPYYWSTLVFIGAPPT
jgi:CHAT domain-containing protein